MDFYGGGSIEYGIEKIGTENGNEANFWIRLGNNPYVDSLRQAEMAELPGSNIAYLLFKNLEAERKKYSNIQSQLIFKDGKIWKFTYSIAQLEKVKSKMSLVNKVVGVIKDKRFKDLQKYLNGDTTFVYNADLLLEQLEKVDPDFGNVIEFIPQGFKFSKLKNGKNILHIAGLMKRDKENNYFSINLDPDITADEIYSLNYNL